MTNTEDGAAKDEAGKKSRALGRAMSSDSFVFAEENTQADAMSTAGRRGKEVAAEDVLPQCERAPAGRGDLLGGACRWRAGLRGRAERGERPGHHRKVSAGRLQHNIVCRWLTSD